MRRKGDSPDQKILFSPPPQEEPQVVYMRIPERVPLKDGLHLIEDCSVLGVDSETTGLDPHKNRMRLLQMAGENQPVLLIDLFALSSPEEWNLLENFFREERLLIFQNARFDLKFLARYRIFPRGPLFDTMIAAQLLDTSEEKRSHSLKSLVKRYLGESLPKEMQQSNWGAPQLTPQQLLYAARDAAVLLPLRQILITKLREKKMIRIAKIEFDCIPAVAAMEYRGIALDKKRFSSLAEELGTEQKQAREKLLHQLAATPHAKAPRQKTLFDDPQIINPDSPKQIIQALQWQGIPLKSSSRRELEKLAPRFEVIRILLEYRHAAKAVQAFGKTLERFRHPLTGRLHPRYGQLQTPTGRFTCSAPNIQQIPRAPRFRNCFEVPPERMLVLGDYSQIELRIAAEISGDSRMIRAYREGADLHLLTAALLTEKAPEQVLPGERQLAKAVNFGLIYAMGAAGLRSYAEGTFGIPMSEEEARNFRKRFFQAYPGIAAWHERERVSPSPELRTLGGRRRIPSSSETLPGRLNTPVQGTAADMLKLALGLLFTRISPEEDYLVGCVHDEILLECPEYRAEEMALVLKETMEEAGSMLLPRVPVEAKVLTGKSWGEKS
ncbi:MAG TPA: bifunctional 3'-5' exonuclease/DNA polymerase [Synergistaceae bacterium]|nr:bifunctional 3'-5' exonuclease/DNA polymerase [Synergistaceae bacterium]HPQ37442.1 bifunctional 3'-5' exonuclease/DNA polymerase [Synergistaceae bacterium]